MYDASFRIIIFGDNSTGRTTFTQKFLPNLFVSDQKMILGVDFETKILTVDGKKVKLEIWDISGEERFRILLPTYARGTQGGIFLYDVTNRWSLDHIDDWLSVIKKKEFPPGVKFPIIAVGLKSEFVEDREISVEEGIKIAESRGLDGHIVCNTKTGENIEELFEGLTKLMMQKQTFEASIKKNEDKQRDNFLENKFLEASTPEKNTIPKEDNSFNSLDTLDDLLKKMLGPIPEVKAATIVSTEGLPIASALPQGIDETKFAAMTAALLSLSERAIIEMGKGDFDQLYIKGSDGYLLVKQVGPNAILAILTTTEVHGEFYGFDRFPYPYIFKPPEPPDDFAMAPQSQIRVPLKEKDPEEEIFCQYCGKELTKEEQSTHSCKKKP